MRQARDNQGSRAPVLERQWGKAVAGPAGCAAVQDRARLHVAWQGRQGTVGGGSAGRWEWMGTEL